MESDLSNSTQDKNFNYLIHNEINNCPNNSNLRYCGRDNFIYDYILNYFHETNNIYSEEICLNETQHSIESDNSFDEDFDIILDLDHYEFITKIKETENNPNTGHNSKSPLDDHNYCLKPRQEKHDTKKDFYNLKTFNDIHNDIDDALKNNKENSDSSCEKNKSTFQSKQPEIYIISDESENEVVTISSDDNDSDCEIISDSRTEYGRINNNYYKMTHEKYCKNLDIPKKYGLSNLNVTNQHDIPNETEYVSMFETYIPYPMYCMENKSIYKNVGNIEYQDVGFNMRLCKNDDLREKFADEAEHSKRMILSMYPSENRRLRRRRQ